MKNKLKVQVLGSGCPKCKKLLESCQEIFEEKNIEVDLEYVNDIEKIISLGVISTPALVINDKTIVSGYLPTKNELEELINKQL